ncbi:MAG: peptidoglycan-binding protein [Spirochaetaceae bacterium]|jgi:hypothetical protein|nr:peptidoglycan-binding protein [Spirochaetaceae bacterium]
MHCDEVLDKVYESLGETLPLRDQALILLHCLWCVRCSEEIKKLRMAEKEMHTQFFPPAPQLDQSIMEQLAFEIETLVTTKNTPEPAAGFSFRSWIITGLVILISFSTVFLGMDFINIANFAGSSFLLPVGITIAAVLTVYGALFIASHLKELSDRFGL